MKTKEQIEIEKLETAKWLSERFGIPAEDVVWYNSGICYSRAIVKTRASAEKISQSVRGDTVNGGFLHGMPLGGISEHKEENGDIYFDVNC